MVIGLIKFIGAGDFTLVTRQVFLLNEKHPKKVGSYNLKYRYSSDYDYFFRMIVKNKLQGIGTKKDELFGIFRRGVFLVK